MLSAEHDPALQPDVLPLVMLPGTLCDARVFEPLRARLPGVPTHVLLTLEAKTLQEAAAEVLARAPERFALLGFSLGGMVAMEAALLAPQRILALALLSTTPLPVTRDHEGRRQAVSDARAVGLTRFVQERLWPNYAGALPCEAMLPLLEGMAESLGHDLFARQTEMALGREDFRPRLGAIRCPALVLSGLEDKVCPPAAAQQLAAGLPNSTSVMLAGAGHFALLEQPGEVARAVAAWLHTAVREESA